MPKNQGMNYGLPATDDAPRICVTLSIPGDQESISNFVGAINTLSLWSNYRRDDLKRGKDIAAIWKQIVQDIEFDLCNIQPEKIIIQEWVEEMCLKCNIRFHNGVLQVLDCGEWVDVDGQTDGVIPTPVVQEPGQPRPAAGESVCFNKTLSAKDRYQLPFPVQPGDIVTISAVTGTWSDGSRPSRSSRTRSSRSVSRR